MSRTLGAALGWLLAGMTPLTAQHADQLRDLEHVVISALQHVRQVEAGTADRGAAVSRSALLFRVRDEGLREIPPGLYAAISQGAGMPLTDASSCDAAAPGIVLSVTVEELSGDSAIALVGVSYSVPPGQLAPRNEHRMRLTRTPEGWASSVISAKLGVGVCRVGATQSGAGGARTGASLAGVAPM